MAVSVQGTPIRTGFSAVRTVSTGTIASYTPAAGDIVVLWARAATGSGTATVPSGWVNPLGGNALAAASTVSVIAVYHVVTSAEATAVTTAWTLTNLWDANQTGAAYTAVLRGVDQVTVIDDFNSAINSTASTTHVLAGLTGTDLSNNSLVLSGVVGDGSSVYASAPSGWSFQVKSASAQNSGALLSLNAVTVAGTNVSATNITAGASQEYADITLAFSLAAAVSPAGNFFAFMT
jgi:hypothetical protein